MGSRCGLQGFSVIHFLSAIILILLAATIHYSSTASSTAIKSTEKVASAQAVNSLARKTPVHFGEKAQLSFDISGSAGSRHANSTIDEAIALRERDDLDWEQALFAGLKSVASLSGLKIQTYWTTTEQLKDSGWSIGPPAEDRVTVNYDGRSGPYSTLGIDRTRGRYIRVAQDIDYDNCYHTHNPATSGAFTNIYNAPGKTIIASNTVSPFNKLKNEEEDFGHLQGGTLPPWEERIPLITYWSQVTGIMWFDQAGDQGGALKYVFRHFIVTDDTQRIMNLAVQRYPESGAVPILADEPLDNEGSNGFKLPWPGVVIKKGERSFQALLGTPHGKGVVRLITDNADKLPGKDIETITMFTSGWTDDEYNLLFTLTD